MLLTFSVNIIQNFYFRVNSILKQLSENLNLNFSEIKTKLIIFFIFNVTRLLYKRPSGVLSISAHRLLFTYASYVHFRVGNKLFFCLNALSPGR